jgi:hypothetical protein
MASGDGENPRDRIRIGDLGPGDVALLKNIATEAADQAVRKWFMVMGLDVEDPIAAQDDFGMLREMTKKLKEDAFHQDLRWLRSARVRAEGITGKALIGAVGVAVLGAMQAMWVGLKSMLSGPMPGAH